MIRAQFITLISNIIKLSPYSNNKGYHEISPLFCLSVESVISKN